MVMLGGQSLTDAMKATVVGSGAETLVLAHGYGTDQTLWAEVAPALAESHRVVAFDWDFSSPAKYSSLEAYAAELVELLEEMGVRECVVVGHSMSAMIGCIASVRRPGLFKHLILVGASPRYLNAEDYEGGFERADLDQMFSAMEFNFPNWASTFAPLAVGAPRDDASVVKFEGCLRAMRPEAALAFARVVFLGDYRGLLEEVTTPCTIVQMKADVVVPASVPYYMQKKLKAKSNVEIVNVEGHFPMLTAPSLLLHVIHKVLAGFVDQLK